MRCVPFTAPPASPSRAQREADREYFHGNDQVWQLILLQGVLGGTCGAILYIPVLLWLPEWFVERRGFVLPLCLSPPFSPATLTVFPAVGLPG